MKQHENLNYFKQPYHQFVYQHINGNWGKNDIISFSCSTTITRTKKSIYPRVYKVRIQQADGSSYSMRYHEPRPLIRLPVDPNSLTEEEKQARLKRLKPEKEIEVHEFDDEETEIIQRSWKDFVASK